MFGLAASNTQSPPRFCQTCIWPVGTETVWPSRFTAEAVKLWRTIASLPTMVIARSVRSMDLATRLPDMMPSTNCCRFSVCPEEWEWT
jgi:hypothetical protein